MVYDLNFYGTKIAYLLPKANLKLTFNEKFILKIHPSD